METDRTADAMESSRTTMSTARYYNLFDIDLLATL